MLDYPLIIFDSGIGGFSILKELVKYETKFVYFADSAYFPYGDKSEEFLKDRFVELAHFFSKQQASGLVIACNTGTVTALSYLRGKLNFPIFGVEPVTKMLKTYHSPVVWGTTITTNSDVALNLRQVHGNHIRYYTPIGLAKAIEEDDMVKVKHILKTAKFELGATDAIGLSCTHYPLVKNIITEVFVDIPIYDPSQAVASHVAKTLKLKIKSDLSLKSQINYQSTGSVVRLKQLALKHGLL
ncbi:MAG: glutamate racemase [Candidatus Microgenomates bacterium]